MFLSLKPSAVYMFFNPGGGGNLAMLGDFEYRVEINWIWFLISALAAMLIALLTVTFQSVKAATADPSQSLRCQ